MRENHIGWARLVCLFVIFAAVACWGLAVSDLNGRATGSDRPEGTAEFVVAIDGGPTTWEAEYMPLTTTVSCAYIETKVGDGYCWGEVDADTLGDLPHGSVAAVSFPEGLTRWVKNFDGMPHQAFPKL